MEVLERKDGSIVILAPSGRLDAATSNDLQVKIEDLLRRGEKRLVIDCAKLSYVSSSGLRVLLLAAKSLAGVSGLMAICCLNENVRRVFEMTRLDTVLDVLNTTEEAIAKLRGTGCSTS